MEKGVQKSLNNPADKGSSAISRQGSNEVWLELKGPSSVNVQKYAVFHAKVHSCGPLLSPSKVKGG